MALCVFVALNRLTLFESNPLAKDRISMAKRQREVEKRDKAARKRAKKESRQSQATRDSSIPFDGKSRVLSIFRRYLMTTGQMLCLTGNELDSNKQTLDELVTAGLLTSEPYKGGYSLTPSGYSAMQSLASIPA